MTPHPVIRFACLENTSSAHLPIPYNSEKDPKLTEVNREGKYYSGQDSNTDAKRDQEISFAIFPIIKNIQKNIEIY